MKKTLLITIALFISIIGYSQTFTENNITYQVTSTSNKTVRVNDYNTTGGADVNIPSSVIDTSVNPTITYSVTDIAQGSFDQKSLNSVVIPNTVISIGVLAFANNSLTTITIPDTIVSIGSSAFQNNQLVIVKIPDSVIALGDYAFANNQIDNLIIGSGITTIPTAAFQSNQLISVTIPNAVTSIGQITFNNNPLTCVISESTNPPTISTNAFLAAGSGAINLSIPTGTASAYATAQWSGFNSIAEGLTGTFVVDHITYQINATSNNEVTITNYNTAGGSTVNIPATVTSSCIDFSVVSIGNSAFEDDSLTNVIIPNSVISIGEDAFNDNQITTLTIGNNVEIIGGSAFANNLIENVIIPSSVTSIEQFAFAYNLLTSIVIPDTVTSIGRGAFRDNQLASATLPSGLISIPSHIFLDNQLTNISIPNTVTNIGKIAFSNNQLTSVTIPSNVTTIGNYVFQGNPLTSVTSLATIPPTIITGGATDSFNTDRTNIDLTIPAGTLGTYVTDSGALWTGFKTVTEDAALSTSNFELTNAIKIVTTENEIRIISNNNVALKNYAVYTISGIKVATGKGSKIPTISLSSGIYILKFDFDTGVFTKKVMVN